MLQFFFPNIDPCLILLRIVEAIIRKEIATQLQHWKGKGSIT